jgi:hypothetical protein
MPAKQICKIKLEIFKHKAEIEKKFSRKKRETLTWPQPTRVSPANRPNTPAPQPSLNTISIVVFLEQGSCSVEGCLTPDPPPLL